MAPLAFKLHSWPPDGATCISYKFDYQMAPLASVTNLATKWHHLSHLHCHIASDCLIGIISSIELVSSTARFTPVNSAKRLRLTQLGTLGPIDRSPGIKSDKSLRCITPKNHTNILHKCVYTHGQFYMLHKYTNKLQKKQTVYEHKK